MNINYILKENEEFISWYEEKLANGYEPCASLEEMQNFIDFVTTWYEIKYPEKEMNYYEDKETMYKDPITNVLDMKELIYRLNDNQLHLASVNYRSKSSYNVYQVNHNGELYYKKMVSYTIIDKINNESIIVSIDSKTGKIEDCTSLKIDKNTSIKGLVKVLNDNYDYTALEKAINNYNIDKKLRNKLFKYICYKLLTSNNTTYEHGYERTLKFLNEFNKYFGLNMPKNELNELKESLKIK